MVRYAGPNGHSLQERSDLPLACERKSSDVEQTRKNNEKRAIRRRQCEVPPKNWTLT